MFQVFVWYNSRYDGTYFTAQKAGLFFFTVNVEIADDIGDGTFYIKKENGDLICYARDDGGRDGVQQAGASCSAVVEMQVNERIYVHSGFANQAIPSTCNFSGFMIRAYN